jgi:hypothetical protein
MTPRRDGWFNVVDCYGETKPVGPYDSRSHADYWAVGSRRLYVIHARMKPMKIVSIQGVRFPRLG